MWFSVRVFGGQNTGDLSRKPKTEYEINIFDFSNINENFRLYWGNIMLIYSAKKYWNKHKFCDCKKISNFWIGQEIDFYWSTEKINGKRVMGRPDKAQDKAAFSPSRHLTSGLFHSLTVFGLAFQWRSADFTSDHFNPRIKKSIYYL